MFKKVFDISFTASNVVPNDKKFNVLEQFKEKSARGIGKALAGLIILASSAGLTALADDVLVNDVAVPTISLAELSEKTETFVRPLVELVESRPMDVSNVDPVYLLGRSAPNFSVLRQIDNATRTQARSQAATSWSGGSNVSNTVSAWMVNCPNFWRPPQANTELAGSRRSIRGTSSTTVNSGWVSDAAQFLTAARGNYTIH